MKEYWRLLEVGEARQKGDEWLDDTCGNHRWKPSEMLGSSVEGSVLYRRRILATSTPRPARAETSLGSGVGGVCEWQAST
jgi:hypothetical protein